MEETLYNIEIHKESNGYLGRLFSDVDGVKEFNLFDVPSQDIRNF